MRDEGGEGEKFINLKQRSIIDREYSLNLMKLLKYATSLVSNSRDEMSRFLIGIREVIKEKFQAVTLHYNMNLCRVMVHFQ